MSIIKSIFFQKGLNDQNLIDRGPEKKYDSVRPNTYTLHTVIFGVIIQFCNIFKCLGLSPAQVGARICFEPAV